MSHSIYLQKLFQPSPRKRLINALDQWFVGGRNQHRVLGTGLSGGIVLGMLAGIRPNISLGVVRKKGEHSHSYVDVETTVAVKSNNSYVVIDDLVSSGDTMRHIADSYGRPDQCKHVLLYEEGLAGGSYMIPHIFPNAEVWILLATTFKKVS
jgi:hypoxanthine phosphoribosyltransferase